MVFVSFKDIYVFVVIPGELLLSTFEIHCVLLCEIILRDFLRNITQSGILRELLLDDVVPE